MAGNAYADYQDSVAKWEETYGTKEKDTLHDRLQHYQRNVAGQKKQTVQSQKRGAR